jgi:dolichol-phosphate mannosyltransferase
MARSRFLIFIPTYNERENVELMCEQLLALRLDADIVFMDDNSPDKTGEILDRLASRHESVAVVHRPGKLGIGAAHKDGLRYAYDRGYEALVTLDCDFTHLPKDIPRLLAVYEQGADLIVGSRYLEDDSLPGWSVIRKGLTNLGHLLTHRLLGISGDATGAFRVYNLKTVPRELLDVVEADGYAFFFESLFIAHANGLRIEDVAIVLPARTYGHSKMSLIEVQRSVRQLVSLCAAKWANPGRFRIPGPMPETNRSLMDPQGWNQYWDKKQRKSTLVYEVAATIYRNVFIKAQLNRAVAREFRPGAALLHAGCGSGQVDRDLHQNYRITACDISASALDMYRRSNPGARDICHASIFDLPFEDARFEGIYNLGVVEHFTRDELIQIFSEFRRVLKPGGKLLLFWPHARATSVAVLHSIHWILNDVFGRGVRLHPAEVSLVRSRRHAESVLNDGGFALGDFKFGPADLFIQAVVTAQPREGAVAAAVGAAPAFRSLSMEPRTRGNGAASARATDN